MSERSSGEDDTAGLGSITNISLNGKLIFADGTEKTANVERGGNDFGYSDPRKQNSIPSLSFVSFNNPNDGNQDATVTQS